MMNMLGLSFVYLAFFLKIYVLDEHPEFTYLHLAPVGVAPLLLMYAYELMGEVCKDRRNWNKKRIHFDD